MRATALSRGHQRFLRATAVLVLAVVAVGGLGGCRVEKRPAPPYPAVEWQGPAPTGQLESDPWVQATRKFLEAEAVARNINDFTLTELVQTAGKDMRSRAARPAIEDVKQKRRPDILPGPTPFLPLSVETNFWGDPNLAAVRGCAVGNWASETGEVPAELKTFELEYRLEKLPGGTLRVVGTSGVSSQKCSDVSVPTALFVPAPEPSDVTNREDIVIAEHDDLDPQ